MAPEIRNLGLKVFAKGEEQIVNNVVNGILDDIRKLNTTMSKNELYSFALSFCENKDSLCMWSNYTNKLGFNISVDTKKLKTCINNNFRGKHLNLYCGYVIYEDDKKQKIIIDLFEDFFNACKLNPSKIKELWVRLEELIVVHAPFFKKSVLSQEQEIRFYVMAEQTILQEYINFKQLDEVNIPYFNLNCEFAECYKGIKIGQIGRAHV